MRLTEISTTVSKALATSWPTLNHYSAPVDTKRFPATVVQCRGGTYHDTMRRSQAVWSLAVSVHVKRSPVDEAYATLDPFVDPDGGVIEVLETSDLFDGIDARIVVSAFQIVGEADSSEDSLVAVFSVTLYDT